MKESEITALAREYADMLKHLFPDMPEHTYRDKMSQAKNVVNIIMRRYCLVEKSKVVAEYKNVAKAVKAKREYNLTLSEDKLAKADLLFDLFPEIAKEVEG